MNKKSNQMVQADDIVKQYYAMIYRYCYLKVSNTHTAQDLVQEVFFRFFQRMDTYKNIQKIKQLLFSIAHNLCVDHYRKSAKFPTELYNEETQEDGSYRDVTCTLTMQDALKQLSYELQETVLLYYYYEFRIKDIACIMHTSESNVKYRLKSSKEKIENVFQKEGLPYEEWFS